MTKLSYIVVTKVFLTNFIEVDSDVDKRTNKLPIYNKMRSAKNNAMKAIVSISDYASEDEVFEDISKDKSKLYTRPINAPSGSSLDLFKHYKRRADFCDREQMRIHDKSINKKDQGSENKGLIYVDFKAGVFEALKENFLKLLEAEHDTNLIADPKVEYYGKALERICLDMRMNVGTASHDIKI